MQIYIKEKQDRGKGRANKRELRYYTIRKKKWFSMLQENSNESLEINER